MELPEGGEKEKGTTKTIERNNDENFPNLMMYTKTQTKAQRTTGRIKVPHPKLTRYIIFELQKIK